MFFTPLPVRFTTSSAVSPGMTLRGGKVWVISRPTMYLISSARFVCDVTSVVMYSPSRRTDTLSEISNISSRRWEMYMIATPSARSLRMIRMRISTSASDSGAVGSSRISMRAFLETALAISTICMWPGVSSRTGVEGSMFTPKSSNRALAFSFIRFWLTSPFIFSP